ncbi:MAG: helix-turn-helix domain-containing protein [Candidatus Hydrogenedentes bacterium]|nr:helix-turn-helix domain-containing protein [Candidatus Hydrogenedentota bacterium]
MARVRLEIEDTAQHMTLKAMLEAEGHTIAPEDPEVVFNDSIEGALSKPAGVPTIVLATASQISDAVRAMQKGVWGYLFVPLRAGEAGLMVQRALAAQARGEVKQADAVEAMRTLEQVELDYIREVVRACKHNQARAARVLGIGRNTLWRKLKKGRGPVEGDGQD